MVNIVRKGRGEVVLREGLATAFTISNTLKLGEFYNMLIYQDFMILLITGETL